MNKMAAEYFNVVYLRFVLAILFFFAINAIEADDRYRCPKHLHNNAYLRTHGDKCYQFVRSEMDWSEARGRCRSTRGDLIIINRRDIQAFVEQSLIALRWNKNGIWIGATDSHDEEDWRWINGDRVRSGFQNWERGQPSCFLFEFMCKEDCACLRLDKGYKWHDYFCEASGFEYGFICQYDMSPPTTTTSTTTTTTTTKTTRKTTVAPPTTTSTTTTTTSATTTEPDPTTTTLQPSSVKAATPTLLVDTSTRNVSLVSPGNMIAVESQRLSSEETGIETGSVVGMVVSFVLVFIAGLIVGIFMCRRRYKKRYEESISAGFNNVLYTAAPSQPSARVKETNVLVAGGKCDLSDDEEVEDHRYVDIDEISACGANRVTLPPCKEAGDSSSQNPPIKESCYDSIIQEEESEEEVGGACPIDAPPPCRGVDMKQFAPEFLKKDTDVSQAYSNNLYGYHK